jgi:hypothetical protein
MDVLFGAAVLSSAVAAGGLLLFVTLFPRLSGLECAAMAAGLGTSASAWLALLLRSALSAVGLARAGLPFELVCLLLAVQCLAVRALWPRARALASAHAARLAADARANAPALAMLAVMAVWWTWTSYYHYLYSRGSDYMAGGSASRASARRAAAALRTAAHPPACARPPSCQAPTRTCPFT